MEPGLHDFSILSNGQKRDGVYFVPSAYDGKKPLPVVFDFHGSNSNPHGQLNRSGWDKLAERDGLVVVALVSSLNGELPGTHAWNVPGVTKRPGGLDEVGFIHDAITMVKGKFCVDEERFTVPVIPVAGACCRNSSAAATRILTLPVSSLRSAPVIRWRLKAGGDRMRQAANRRGRCRSLHLPV